MRNGLYCLLFLVFISCKKDKTPSGDKHLTKITGYGGTPFYVDFSYDGSGRLTSQTATQGTNPPIVFTQIGYTGNEIAITYPRDPSTIQNSTKYQLDANNRPIKRTYTSFEDFSSGAAFGPEHHYGNETTNYEYNAGGSVFRYTGLKKDSMSYYPAANVIQYSTNTISYTATYEFEAGNVKSVTRTLQQSYWATEQPGSTYTIQTTVEETTVFFYDKKYPNQFDFKNAFLFREIEILPFPLYMPDKSFTNFPNKAVTTRITKNGAGAVLSTDVSTEETELNFDREGFISGRNADPANKQVFSYNRF